MTESTHENSPDSFIAANECYVAVRWPASHVVFHLLLGDPLRGEDADAGQYEAIRERVIVSVREALDAMDVHVVETTEEAIGG